jgi:thiol:disulfide interchange protein DsbA
MTFRKLFVLLIFLFFISVPVQAEKNPSIQGVYTKLPGHEFVFDGEKVEIIEFLSFYCGHCYDFEKTIPVIKGNFPKKIAWKVVPVYWGKGSSKPGEAYLLAEEAGKGEQMKMALFEAFFVEKKDIGNIEVLEDLGMKTGLGFDFSHRLRKGDKAKEAGEAFIKLEAYGVEETPSLIIAGNLKTSPGMMNSMEAFRDNVITILKNIFKK